MNDARDAQCSARSVWGAHLLPKGSVRRTGHLQKGSDVIRGRGRVGNKRLIFWYSIQYHNPQFGLQNTVTECIWSFSSEESAAASGVEDERCPVTALRLTVERRGLSPKAWATHTASCLCYSSTECLSSSECCKGERTWVFQQLAPVWGLTKSMDSVPHGDDA